MKEAEILKEGKILIYPTDTIWGIGCDALNISAIEKVKQIKDRDNTKSFILLMRDEDMIKEYIPNIPPTALTLLHENQKKNIPTTILYPNPVGLPMQHLSFNNYIGIRIPDNDFLQEVFKEFPFPIVSSSANFSGKESPRFFNEIDKDFLSKADYVSLFYQDDCSIKESSSIFIITEDNSIKQLR